MSERKHLDWNAALLREVAAGRQVSLTVLSDSGGEPLWMSPTAEGLWLAARSERLRAAIRAAAIELAHGIALKKPRFRAELNHIPCVVEVSRFGSDREPHLLLARLSVDVPRRLALRYGLTRAEIRVVEQVASGARNEDIGKTLRVSLNTVRTHVSRILQKFKAESRAKVASAWAEARFFEDD